MPGSELLHSQAGQQFKKMASPCGIALRIDLPYIDGNPELPGDDIENRAVRSFVDRQHSSWKPAMLPDESQVRLRQRVQPNQIALIRWEGEQVKAL